MFNAWTIWWNADRAANSYAKYWDAPIFYPTKNAFAFSEPQPLSILVAPVWWSSGSLVLTYNAYLWLSLTLNGFLTLLFLRSLKVADSLALVGGAGILLLPIVHWQLGVLQLVPVWPIIWTWLAFSKLLLRDSGESTSFPIRVGIELGLAAAVTVFSSAHHALFLALLMVLSAWTLGRQLKQIETWNSLLIGVLVSVLLSASILLHLHKMKSISNFTRPIETVEQLSLNLSDYGNVYGHTLVPSIKSSRYWQVSPGWLKWPFTLLGIIACLLHHRYRNLGYFLACVGVLSVVFSFGTNLAVADFKIWPWLVDNVPGFAQVRSAFRFGYFAQMVVVLTACLGFSQLYQLAETRSKAWQVKALHCSIWLIAVVVMCDPWPRTPRLGVLPERTDAQWILHLKEVKPRALFCLPMAGGSDVRDFEITTEWMLYACYHRIPLVDGYSGFNPQSYWDLQEAVLSRELDAEILEQLCKNGVEMMAVDRKRFKVPFADEAQIGKVSVKCVLHDDSAGIDLYKLETP